MKSLKTILFGATVALSFVGTTALADTLYTVKSGDTLSSISTSFVGDNSLINQIAEDNQISDINLIFPGQELTIKTDGTTEVSEPTTQPTETTEATTTEDTTQYTTQEDTSSDYSDSSSSDSSSTYTGESSSAKEWIAQKESGGSYSATNGQYIGRYQLTDSYLNGDYSAENQERVADQYVAERYGSWEAAQQFWMNNGWY